MEKMLEQYSCILQAHMLAYVLAAVCCHKACTYTVSWIVLLVRNGLMPVLILITQGKHEPVFRSSQEEGSL